MPHNCLNEDCWNWKVNSHRLFSLYSCIRILKVSSAQSFAKCGDAVAVVVVRIHRVAATANHQNPIRNRRNRRNHRRNHQRDHRNHLREDLRARQVVQRSQRRPRRPRRARAGRAELLLDKQAARNAAERNLLAINRLIQATQASQAIQAVVIHLRTIQMPAARTSSLKVFT